jgi:hypothetical protein
MAFKLRLEASWLHLVIVYSLVVSDASRMSAGGPKWRMVSAADSSETDGGSHGNGELQERNDVKGDDSHPSDQKRT